tara:strand:- start:338 stop:550 length:213 start_codon:yes stop_codon:yes gene_type:complete
MIDNKGKDNKPCNIQRVSFRVWGNWWRELGDTERLRLKDKHYPKLVKEHMYVFNCMSKKIQKMYINEHDG